MASRVKENIFYSNRMFIPIKRKQQGKSGTRLYFFLLSRSLSNLCNSSSNLPVVLAITLKSMDH